MHMPFCCFQPWVAASAYLLWRFFFVFCGAIPFEGLSAASPLVGFMSTAGPEGVCSKRTDHETAVHPALTIVTNNILKLTRQVGQHSTAP